MIDGKIAIPSEGQGGWDAQRSGHFGHCPFFTLVEVAQGKVTEITTIPTPPHQNEGCMVPVNLLAQNKVTALIAAGMGMRPLMGFNEAGIDVFFDTNYPKVSQAVEQLLAGNLEKMTMNNVCGGH